MANFVLSSININDYKPCARRTSSSFLVRSTNVACTFVLFSHICGVHALWAQSFDGIAAPNAILENRLADDVELDPDADDTFAPVPASRDGSHVGFVWSFAGDGFTDVRYSYFDTEAFDGGESSLGEIFTVNEILDFAFETASPDITAFKDGDYFIGWADDREIEGVFDLNARIISPSGEQFISDEIAVNGPKRFQETVVEDPTAATFNDTASVVWTDDRDSLRDVYMRRFFNSGDAADSNDYRINPGFDETNSQQADVAHGTEGTVGVVWADDRVLFRDADGNEAPRFDVYVRVLSAGFRGPQAGEDPATDIPDTIPEYQLTAERTYGDDAVSPRIAAGPDETFLVVWHEVAADGGDIYLSYLGSNGDLFDDRVRVDMAVDIPAQSTNPDAVLLSNDFFIITWQDDAHAGSLLARIWDPFAGIFVSGEYRVETPIEGSGGVPVYPRLAAGRAGDVVTTWDVGDVGSASALFTLHRFYLEGDLNNDGVIAGADLLYYNFHWSPETTVTSPADLNADGVVSRLDLIRQYELVQGSRAGVFLKRRIGKAPTEPPEWLKTRPRRAADPRRAKAVRSAGAHAGKQDARPRRAPGKHGIQRSPGGRVPMRGILRRTWNKGILMDVQGSEALADG